MLKHTRAMRSRFGVREQTKHLNSSEKCYKSATPQHNRAAMTHFWSEEQDKYAMVSMAFKSLGKYLKHTKMVALCFL